MPIEEKNNILSKHPYLRLRLSHAAIGTYPCHVKANVMMVNRLIIVFDDSDIRRSIICDSVSKEKFIMEPGHYYFVPCNHQSDWDFSPRLRFVSLHFNLEPFYGFDVFRNYPGCFSGYDPELAVELQNLIHRDEEILTLCRLNEVIYHLCVVLLAHYSEPVQFNAKWKDYEKVFAYLQQSGDATTTVEFLATIMNRRNNVFSRNFTRDIGITPKNFLMNTLVRKASEILLIPRTSVKQTAETLNFSSEYYFSNFFKRQTGMSPREFQRHHDVE